MRKMDKFIAILCLLIMIVSIVSFNMNYQFYKESKKQLDFVKQQHARWSSSLYDTTFIKK
jgi:hypothetical protein